MNKPMNQSAQTAVLYNDIVNLLQSLPNISDSMSQQGFIRSARLDEQLFKQIQFGGSTAQFFQVLVPTLAEYGTLDDGRDPLAAVLEAAKGYVGQEKQANCDQLMKQLYAAGRPNPRLQQASHR